MCTVIRDAGRYGYRKFGVPLSPAADIAALHTANVLVKNPRDSAAIEYTMTAPKLFFAEDCQIAITGAEVHAKLNGASIRSYSAVNCFSGDILDIGEIISGARGYIAFAGGIKAETYMGSASVYEKAGMGRKFKADDEITLLDGNHMPLGTGYRTVLKPMYCNHVVIRVLTNSGAVPTGSFSVSPLSDSMGVRLQGERLEGGGILSEGAYMGLVQVPPDGNLIILMNDCQTTGGYRKLMSVITADMPKVAQLRAGDTVNFTEVDIDTARNALIDEKKRLDALEAAFADTVCRDFSISIRGRVYSASVKEIF